MPDNNENSNSIEAARQKMIAARFGKVDMTHGKGAARRKKKVKSRSAAAQSDAKLTSVIHKLGATNIPGIEEVNFFQEDGTVLQFANPKLQASIAANTYVVSGPSKTKNLQELLPSLVNQFGGTTMEEVLAAQAAAANQPATIQEDGDEEDDDDDDEVPDLVDGNFEDVAGK
jgi:nascent polypeptide-associated complex subunit beta